MAANKPPAVGEAGAQVGGKVAGSIADIGERLLLWSRRCAAGLARVEFADETARRRVVGALRRALAAEDIALHEITLEAAGGEDKSPPAAVGARLTEELLARLRALPPGVVSLAGLAAALPPAPADLAAALYGFNLRREPLAATAQRQIWWMPPHFATAFVQAVPDLDSWFLVRLHLRETSPAVPARRVPRRGGDGRDDDGRDDDFGGASVAHRLGDPDSRLDPAARRRLAADYAARYERAAAEGAPEDEIASLRERAVDLLRAGGLADEAQALQRALSARTADEAPARPAGDAAATPSDRPPDDTPRLFAGVGEVADALLRRLAWLAPEAIPDSLLDTPMPAASDEAAAATPGMLRAALGELERRVLVRRADDGQSFRAHPSAQAESRHRQRDEARQSAPDGVPPALRAALAWVNAALVGDPLDVRDWPRLEPLVPHAQAVAAFADAAGIAEPTSRLLSDAGLLLQEKARYPEAEPLMRRALAIDEASLGGAHPTVAIRLSNLAQLLRETNRLAEAEPLMRRALAIDEASLGGAHPRVAIDLNNLAALLQATNRLAEAEPLMRRALAIDEASLGGAHPRVAIRLNNLAQVLQATNRPAEAEPLLRRALAIGEASLGGAHPNVAIALNNLAHLLKATNRLAEAEPLLRRALAIDEASLGGEHPRVAIRLNNLAQVLQATNRLAEAEPLLRRALRIFFVSLGGEHPHTRIVRENTVELLRALGRGEDEIAATLDGWLAT